MQPPEVEIKRKIAEQFDLPSLERVDLARAEAYLHSPEREIDLFLDKLAERQRFERHEQ